MENKYTDVRVQRINVKCIFIYTLTSEELRRAYEKKGGGLNLRNRVLPSTKKYKRTVDT